MDPLTALDDPVPVLGLDEPAAVAPPPPPPAQEEPAPAAPVVVVEEAAPPPPAVEEPAPEPAPPAQAPPAPTPPASKKAPAAKKPAAAAATPPPAGRSGRARKTVEFFSPAEVKQTEKLVVAQVGVKGRQGPMRRKQQVQRGERERAHGGPGTPTHSLLLHITQGKGTRLGDIPNGERGRQSTGYGKRRAARMERFERESDKSVLLAGARPSNAAANTPIAMLRCLRVRLGGSQ